jgi:hypothetical protein
VNEQILKLIDKHVVKIQVRNSVASIYEV